MSDNKELKEKRKKALVELLLRQTDMTYEVAEEQLNINNYDVIKTLRQYMNPDLVDNKKQLIKENKTINQMIYKEIRQTMDKASLNFLRKQEYQRELEKRRQYLLEQYQRQHELERHKQIESQLENNLDKLD
jgi:hypothetical protein